MRRAERERARTLRPALARTGGVAPRAGGAAGSVGVAFMTRHASVSRNDVVIENTATQVYGK